MQQPIRVLVTGANKGIGYGIIEHSLRSSPVGKYQFLLGSRDLDRGRVSREKLLGLFPQASIEVVELDVSSPESVDKVVKHLLGTAPVDALINNAGILTDKAGNLGHKQLNEIQLVNFHSPRRLIDAFLQNGLIKENGKIINVSSSLAQFSSFGNSDPFTKPALQNYLTTLTYEELDAFVQKYEKEVLAPETTQAWKVGEYCFYCHSKTFLSAYTAVLGRDPRITSKGIQTYSVDPGWCETDMTVGSGAPLTYLDGAKTPFFLLELPNKISPEHQGHLFSKSVHMLL